MFLGAARNACVFTRPAAVQESFFKPTNVGLIHSIFRSFSQSPNLNGENRKLIVTTYNNIPGCRISEMLGIARGSERFDTSSGFGLGVGDYAYDQMVQSAKHMNADAVVGVRHSTLASEHSKGVCLWYGNAVTLTETK